MCLPSGQPAGAPNCSVCVRWEVGKFKISLISSSDKSIDEHDKLSVKTAEQIHNQSSVHTQAARSESNWTVV